MHFRFIRNVQHAPKMFKLEKSLLKDDHFIKSQPPGREKMPEFCAKRVINILAFHPQLSHFDEEP